MVCAVALFILVRRALTGGVRRFSAVTIGARGGIGTLSVIRRTVAPGICVPISERHIASERGERNTYENCDELSHDVFTSLLLRLRWTVFCRRPRARAGLCIRMGERHVLRAGSSG